ncbi:unnamed protein product [Ceutorhynchus assimilis]|uniref:TAF6 C-terminal HEAT repeat domain-containing protein n=1 Tax=Ceutorhynchus assimilis TaxID=467358 RepID=A0A9N9QPE8_9CUCU|nr:unnamed protein product [Ceutorhynchus assimilis]
MTQELSILEKKLDQIIKNTKFVPKPDFVYLKLLPAIHNLSKEEQIYFKNLTEPIFGYNEQLRNGKLKQLATDYHVTLILPYLCTFIKDTVHFNLVFTDLTLLIYAMRMVKSLLANKNVNLKPYIHEILPAVLSCSLARNISKYYVDNHWTLREFAGVVVASICATYSDNLNNIKQKVIEIYNKGIVDADKGLTTSFGAIKGFYSLGEEEVKTHLIPKIMIISKKIQRTIENNYQNFGYMEQKHQTNVAKHVRTVMVTVCAPILYKTRNVNDGGLTYARDFGYLGKSLYIQVKNIESAQLAKQMQHFNNVLNVSSLVNQSMAFNSGNPNILNGNQNLTPSNVNQNLILNRANGNQNVMPNPLNQNIMLNPAYFNTVITPGIRPLNSSLMKFGPAPNSSWFKKGRF